MTTVAAMNPWTLCFLDKRLERDFTYVRHCESSAITMMFVVLCSGTAVLRWWTNPWRWPGMVIRITHHVGFMATRLVLDRCCGERRSSEVLPWILCGMTWLGGTCFALLHWSERLDPMYYSTTNERPPWMELAFLHALRGTNAAGGDTTTSGWSSMLSDGHLTIQQIDVFCLLSTGFLLSSFAVRRIGIPFVPRIISLLGVCVPFLSICSEYDVVAWAFNMCALCVGELLNLPVEKRWRLKFLETYRKGDRDRDGGVREHMPRHAASPRGRHELLDVAERLLVMGGSFYHGCTWVVATAFVLSTCMRPLDAVVALLVGALLFHAVDIDLRLVNRKELEKIQQAVAQALEVGESSPENAQMQMANYVFHELRNDQNAIRGFLSILADEVEAKRHVVSPTVHSLLHDVRQHADHATQVIDNMLELSKLRANALITLPNEPVELGALCSECITLVKHLVAGLPVVLSADVDPDLPPVCGAPFHIKQVLLNLLSNACKYTKSGRIVLKVQRASRDEEVRHTSGVDDATLVHFAFAVSDSGCGIDPQRQRAIFKPYTQGPAVGTGLGLPLCCALVQLMGGNLSVHSRGWTTCSAVGHYGPHDRSHSPDVRVPAAAEGPTTSGSTFFFEIPLQRSAGAPVPVATDAQAAESAAVATPAAERSVEPLSVRVLIADDLKMNRVVLKHALTKALPAKSLDVLECSSGEAALELLSAELGSFDLAFLDENFGSGLMQGTDVTRAVRQLESSKCVSHPMLIIGCTGNAGPGELDRKCMDSGQDAVVAKPLPQDFAERLARLLARRGP